MKYRRFKKLDSNYWITYDDFKANFESIICSVDRADTFHTYKRMEYKPGHSVACHIEVLHSTMLTVSVSQLDVVNYPKEYEYTVLRSFLVREGSAGKENQKETFELIKSSYHPACRDSLIEIKLERGVYKLLLDVEPKSSEYGNCLNLNFFYDKKINIETMTFTDASNLLKSVLSLLAIRRGIKSPFVADGSVRKYVLEAPKLGMTVHTYANRSKSFYTVAEKLAPFSMLCSKALEDGDKLLVSMPPNSLKVVTYRYKQCAQAPPVKTLETSCLMK